MASWSASPAANGRFEWPFAPGAEYDYRVEFTRTAGTGAISFILAGGGHQFAWTLSAANNSVAAFGLVDGMNGWGTPANKTAVSSGAIQ